MIFSSHRFGQLTKPADLILYVDPSVANGHLVIIELELNKYHVVTQVHGRFDSRGTRNA